MSSRVKTLAGFWGWGLALTICALAAADAGKHTPAFPAFDRLPFAGPEGEALPFATDEETLEFLNTAAVVSRTEVPTGINRPLKLLLEKDGIRMHAVFRTVDKAARRYRTHDRMVLKFHDFHGFEVAAYRLSRLLGIDNVPPAVLRTIDGQPGSVQVWIENARTEGGRREAGDKPPGSLRWVRQWQVMRVLDALIDNFDRNIGNILIDSGWKVWLVDHTRSFTIHRHAFRPDRIHQCERQLWQRLHSLDAAAVSASVGDLLDKTQINALMKRRDLLIRHFEELIAQRGEAAVLFEPSGARISPGEDRPPD